MILRFILLVSLAIWFGGFTFYSTAVIYTAQEVLHSHLRAGLITQQVTRWLNLVSLPPLLLCLFHQYRLRFAWREWFVKILGMALLIMILTQAGLFLMHPVIDAQVVDREFRMASGFSNSTGCTRGLPHFNGAQPWSISSPC